MTQEEFNSKRAEIRKTIDALHKEEREIIQQFVADNAKYQIGDKVSVDGKVGYIVECRYDWRISYHYVPNKKNRERGSRVTRIWEHENVELLSDQ